MIKVKLIDYSNNALGNIVRAARGCFGNKKKDASYEDDVNLVKALIAKAHSPIEFAWAMFDIQGISRVCANQLNRYRMTSQAQESMRYVEVKQYKTDSIKEYPFVYPYSALKISDACEDIVKICFKFYDKLVKAGVPKEDARMFLPLGTETRLKIACNFRELRHILKQRLDKHAQWEVRQVAKEILYICDEKWPWLVEDLKKLE